MQSLRKLLLIPMLSAFVLALVLFFAFSYERISHEIEEVFDAELAQTARMITQLTLANIDSTGTETSISLDSYEHVHKYEKHISYQVWFQDSLVLRSESAPDMPLASRAGYNDEIIDGKEWRVFAMFPESSPFRIFTAEDYQARNELSLELAIESMKIFLWLLPVLAILIIFTVNKGLAPLKRLSEEVRSRDINQLKPISSKHVPVEIQPVIQALNELLASLDAAVTRERRFTADASHELRTPLTSIRLHAQLAMRSTEPADREHALRQIMQAVDQSTHLIEQMLTLTKASPEGHIPKSDVIDLNSLCESLLDELNDAIAVNKVTIEIDTASSENLIAGTDYLAHAILRNLLDNAIRYSHPEGSIRCRIQPGKTRTTVLIEDEGPGIPAEQISQVTERFFRLAGQEIDGCGLGLSIATEAAQRIGATIELRNRTDVSSGLAASVTFRNPGAGAT